ncbi:S8 family serine peptidase [Leptolyngbya sp. NK1-12]|uniref:S8 family serine peptidase n=1 Tax=Leptolyngbya sp. NK1-12 TaxID=2547451 RepID=A0AA97AHP9_9CYAN|nr:S8 family serine peptidase [Leptolyngbya sp. NK1-12]
MSTTPSVSQINLDKFRSSSLFSGIDGKNSTIVIIDDAIKLSHPLFGPDTNGDKVADRFRYPNDPSAPKNPNDPKFSGDFSGDADTYPGVEHPDPDPNPEIYKFINHGTAVSSIAATTAPGTNIIHLKVFPDDGSDASAQDIKEALDWVFANAAQFNVTAVNMSFGSGDFSQEDRSFDYVQPIEQLAAKGIPVIAATGNNFQGKPGVINTAAAPYTISVGAVDKGDKLADFSQRHPLLTDILAPGVDITGATYNGGTKTDNNGTSFAAPQITGVVALAQELAVREMNRKLTVPELTNLLKTTGVEVKDEQMNGVYRRVDMYGLGEGILTTKATGGILPTTQGDRLAGTVGNDYMAGFDGNDELLGNGGDDTLIGGKGNDTINGSLGNDAMTGGDGDDLYLVDSNADVIVEVVNGGKDQVTATSSYALSENLENLDLDGNKASNGTGNSLDNLIQGNNAKNQLSGSDGNDELHGRTGDDLLVGDLGDDRLFGDADNDSLIGGLGSDWLAGGEGRDTLRGGLDADRFVFNTLGKGADRIADFKASQDDQILVSARGFGGKLKLGDLSKKRFTLGSRATGKQAQFIYDAKDGELFYDSDGIGGRKQTLFAELAPKSALSRADIAVIA